MAEIFEGTLSLKGEGKNQRRFLGYTSKKGKPMSEMVNPDKFSPSLRMSQEAELTVSFELDPSGRPFRIRAQGEEWVERVVPTNERSSPADTNRRPPPGDFHNPYNFVPAPPRPKTDSDLDDVSSGELCGHARYYPDRWSGRIAIRLITRTPILVVDATMTIIDGKDHKTFGTRIDSKGNPHVPPTSIKGMLRSAYESVTNSRFGVFEKHQDRLAYRMPAKIGPVPARVETHDGVKGLRVMQAAVMGYAAKLSRYQDGRNLPRDKGEATAALRFPDNSLPRHREAVWVQVDRSRCSRIELRTIGENRGAEWQAGWVCVTGPNINRKRFERVFLEGPRDPFVPITIRHEHLWRELIENYRETHERDLKKRRNAKGGPIQPQDYLGDKPGETGWSRHVYGEDETSLTEGTLCYVEFADDIGTEVTALIPVTISRRLYSVSPDPLLPDSLKPARTSSQLSPADRVFGWVNQSGQGSYRGNLRVGSVTCTSSDPLQQFSKLGVPLAILGQPKPQQARFYVAESTQGQAQTNGIPRDKAGYWAHKGLRGRKVYPHHGGLPENHWEKPEEDRTQQGNQGFFQEYRRPHAPVIEERSAKLNHSHTGFELRLNEEQRDDQNRSVTSWIKPQTDFEFCITVTNLTDVELGALLWLLDLPSDHHHRLGGGKPLGFGSVHLSVDWAKSDLHLGTSVRESYCSLNVVPNMDQPRINECVQIFRNAIARAYGSGEFERASFIAAFRAYAKGFSKPVHYPRTLQRGQSRNGTIPPHPEGKAFEWFVANERTGRDGGPKLSLQDLVNDEGLPILESR